MCWDSSRAVLGKFSYGNISRPSLRKPQARVLINKADLHLDIYVYTTSPQGGGGGDEAIILINIVE